MNGEMNPPTMRTLLVLWTSMIHRRHHALVVRRPDTTMLESGPDTARSHRPRDR